MKGVGRAHEFRLTAGGDAIAQKRAHRPKRQDAAGFRLTIHFESHGGSVQVCWAGGRGVRQEWHLLACTQAVGGGLAARKVREVRESNGGNMGNDESGFFDTRRAADCAIQ